MVLDCGLFVALKTSVFCGWKQVACLNSVFYSVVCFCFFWVGMAIFFRSGIMSQFRLRRLLVFQYILLVLSACFAVLFLYCFRFIRSLVGSSTQSTLIVMSIFFSGVFREFGYWLDFFARRALFCYNSLRHGFSLIKKLCLEPITAHTVVGSLYYNVTCGGVK